MSEFKTGDIVKYSHHYLSMLNEQWRGTIGELRGEIIERFTENENPFATVQWIDGVVQQSPLYHLDHAEEDGNANA